MDQIFNKFQLDFKSTYVYYINIFYIIDCYSAAWLRKFHTLLIGFKDI